MLSSQLTNCHPDPSPLSGTSTPDLGSWLLEPPQILSYWICSFVWTIRAGLHATSPLMDLLSFPNKQEAVVLFSSTDLIGAFTGQHLRQSPVACHLRLSRKTVLCLIGIIEPSLRELQVHQAGPSASSDFLPNLGPVLSTHFLYIIILLQASPPPSFAHYCNFHKKIYITSRGPQCE